MRTRKTLSHIPTPSQLGLVRSCNIVRDFAAKYTFDFGSARRNSWNQQSSNFGLSRRAFFFSVVPSLCPVVSSSATMPDFPKKVPSFAKFDFSVPSTNIARANQNDPAEISPKLEPCQRLWSSRSKHELKPNFAASSWAVFIFRQGVQMVTCQMR